MKSKIFLTGVLTILAIGAVEVQAAGVGSFAIDCTGSQANEMNPDKFDTRHLAIQIDGQNIFGGSAYKEERVYNGGYPTSDEVFGAVTNVRSVGKKILFTLVSKGKFGIAGIPTLVKGDDEVIPASLDLETSVLTLDTSKVIWFYKNPSVLNCKE